jgi:signal transduction histidine kinase
MDFFGFALVPLRTSFSAGIYDKSHGMGLGLAIYLSTVEEHGGRLWFTPNRTGRSVFRFSLPDPSMRKSNAAAT